MQHERIQPNQAHAGFLENMRIMNDIMRQMKEIPELPSEEVKDSHPLTKVEFADDGSVFTYMDGYDYPYRGFPFFEMVDKMDLVKKIIRQTQSSFYHALKNRNKLILLGLISTIPVARSFIWAYAYVFDRIFERFRIKPGRMSKAVRELHRAASVDQGETKQIKELREMLRNIECMILELDNAYRFRFQDIFQEIDKTALKKWPIRELNRVIDVWIEREVREETKDSWRLLKKFVNYYLRFDRKFLHMIVGILLEIDPKEVELQVEDKYYAAPREDYRFGFVQNPTPEDKETIRKAGFVKLFSQDKERILKESNQAHQELFTRHSEERNETLKHQSEEERNRLNGLYLQKKQEMDDKYRKDINELVDSFLTQEQIDTKNRQEIETRQLDSKFESQLKERDEYYTNLKNGNTT